MEQIEYDEAGKKVVAVIDEEQAKKSSDSWNMLVYNTLQGVFPIHYYYIDNKVCFQYMTEGYVSISQYFRKKKVGFETVYFLCQGILSILEESQEYLLEAREFLLGENWIFWNRSEKAIMLCYLPGREGSGETEFLLLVEKLLQVTDHQDKKAVEFVYGLYDYIQSDGFTIDGVRAFLRQYDAVEPMACSTSSPIRLSDDSSKGSAKENATVENDSEHYAKEKAFISGSKEMQLVFDSKNNRKEWGDLKSYLEELRYPLSGEKLVVGRSHLCDIILPFGSVSAKHAVVSQQKGTYYIRDMQSSNGVFLNGEPVTDFEKKAIKVGDCISFGGICFTLKEREQDLFDIPV